MKQEKTAYMGEVYSTKRQSSPVELHPVPTEQVLAGCKNERARKIELNKRLLAASQFLPQYRLWKLKSEVFTG